MMTLGQRIAQKRKELGLSQEGLGEQLGVSRQAIYKWESDSSLPEIDKLIALSKLFSVSVGWLLGVEEEQTDAPAQEAGELTEAQLQMVQEIVDRYLAAQPAPQPPKRRRLVKVCGVVAALCLVWALFSLFSKLDRMTQDYDNLRWSVDNVSGNVNSQINSITSRVESILKSQNALTADWSAQLASTDLRANTATFDVRAVPKTYVEGMTAVFQAHNGEETVELPVEPGADHAFSGQITCSLSDYIDLSVVFLTEDKRETQWLEDFYGLYSGSFPDLWVHSWIWASERDGVLAANDSHTIDIRNLTTSEDNWRPNSPAKLQVGLFRDRKLLFWYEEIDKEINLNGTRTQQRVWNRQQEVTLEPGHTYTEAAVYTDEYGRQFVYEGHAPLEYSTAEQSWSSPTSYALNPDPANWEF